jgi:hypothetical protein
MVVMQCGLYVRGTVRKQITFVEFWPPRVTTVSGQLLDDLRLAAERVYAEIELKYPPRAAGWARVLPWHWAEWPRVPQGAEAAMRGTYKLKQNVESALARGWTTSEVAKLAAVIGGSAVDDMKAAAEAAQTKVNYTGGWLRFWIGHLHYTGIVLILLELMMIVTILLDRGAARRRQLWKQWSARQRLGALLPYPEEDQPIEALIVLVVYLAIAICISPPNLRWSVVGIFGSMTGVGWVATMCTRLDYPRNPYMALVGELQPLDDAN